MDLAREAVRCEEAGTRGISVTLESVVPPVSRMRAETKRRLVVALSKSGDFDTSSDSGKAGNERT